MAQPKSDEQKPNEEMSIQTPQAFNWQQIKGTIDGDIIPILIHQSHSSKLTDFWNL